MKQLIILLLIMVSVSGYSSAHKAEAPDIRNDASDSLMIWEKLNIQCDPGIIELLKQQTTQGKKNGTTSGYRLQIYFGSGEKAHDRAIKIKTEFLSSNPNVMAYLLFKSPDFIVRIGNFRTKSEALKMQKALTYQYPNAFIVGDDIALPELVNNVPIN